MKTIVFLMGMLMTMSVNVPLSAEAALEIRPENIEGEDRLVIEGKGHHPFEIMLGNAEDRYVVNDWKFENGHYALYGYAMLERNASYYDGFLLVLSETGDVVKDTIIDFDHLEEVLAVHWDQEGIYAHVRQSINNQTQSIDHRRDFLLDVTDGVEVLHEQNQPIRRVLLEKQGLYFSEEYEGYYEQAVHVKEGLLPSNAIHGMENNGQFRGPLEVHALCASAMFEGEAFERSMRIDYPGHYTMVCDEETYAFTVHPTIEGVSLHDTAIAPVSIDVSGGRLWLNDDLYVNKTLVDHPGYYTLRIEGVNGFEYKAPFTLTSGLEGVEDEGIYDGMKTIFFNGEGHLNDAPISSGHVIEKSGLHTLRISGTEGYEETVEFEVLNSKGPPISNLLRFEVLIAVSGVVLTGGLIVWFLRKR